MDVDFPVYVHGTDDAVYRYLCVWVFSTVRLVEAFLSNVRME